MKKSIFQRALTALAAAALLLCVASASPARQGGTTRYVYDENGRLHAVITPAGEAVVYEYDAAGNIASVRRVAADELALFAFTPHAGLYGDPVTFIGTGLGGVTDVSFNGTPARILSTAGAVLVAEVPQGATTGPVTLTSPRGSVTTAEPFVIAGVLISPAAAVVKFGQTVQFTAQVLPSTNDQTVAWSVNGVTGGSANDGTISAAGVYTAPSRQVPPVTIRATSVADAQRYAEALVRVQDPADIQSVLSAFVSVSRGVVDTARGALSPSVTVQYGVQGNTQTALAPLVSVQHGSESGVTSTLSPNVSVERAGASGASAASPSVSVSYRGDTGDGTLTAYSTPVSVNNGPNVTALSPGSVTRGSTVTLTITGTNLGGATALGFLNAAGGVDTALNASNISVSADGTTLTATLVVGTGAAVGRHVVVIAYPSGDTVTVDIGANAINVQ